MAYFSLRRFKIMLVLLAAAVFLLVLFTAPELIRILIIAGLLAYVLEPLPTRMEARGLSRTLSTAVVFLGLLMLIGIFLFLLLPVITQEIRTIQTGFSPEQAGAFLANIESIVQNKFAFLGLENLNLMEKVHSAMSSIGNKIFGYLVNVVSLITNLVIIPFIVFFLLKDGQNIKRQFVRWVPNRYFEFTLNVLHKMDIQLGNYLRGIFLDAALVGILSIFALRILDVKFYFVIGAFAGVANIIPYIGPIAGAVPAIIVTLLETGNVTGALYIAVAFAIIQLIDNVVFQPLVLARSINLHPLIVLLVVIVGGKLFGVLGMLLAVPFTGVVKVILQETIQNFQKYRFI